MSTDIHAIVEVRRGDGWVLAEPHKWVAREYFGQVDETDCELFIPRVGFDQNYELFALLADERNFRYPIDPIAPARGFPEDASAEARSYLRAGKGWRRCSSWLLLADLLAFDWTAEVDTPSGPRSYARLATRCEEPDSSLLFSRIFPKLAAYGEPQCVRVLFFFY